MIIYKIAVYKRKTIIDIVSENPVGIYLHGYFFVLYILGKDLKLYSSVRNY
ncbi:hypothetical protein NLV77_001867 [Staphylococcus ureilyticus]|nr:hypothetical protein [Staphylococcus ureilyticus]